MQIVIIAKDANALKTEMINPSNGIDESISVYIAQVETFEDVVIANDIYTDLVLLTDEDRDSGIWAKLAQNIDCGFVISSSELELEMTNNLNIKIECLNNMNKAIRYLKSSISNPKSKMNKFLHAGTELKTTEKQLPYTEPAVEELPYTEPAVEELPYTEPAVEELPYTEPVVEELPYTEPVAAELPYTEPVVEELPYTEPVAEELPYTEPVAEESFIELEINRVSDDMRTIEQLNLEKQIEKKKKELDELDLKYRQRKRTQSMILNSKFDGDCKKIGIWSPSSRQGVTTFTMNYAHFLSDNGYQTIILEGLRSVPYIKSKLKSYTTAPPGWSSYAQNLKDITSDMDKARWIYKNVMYLPLDSKDLGIKWDKSFIKDYVKTVTAADVLLIDFENGPMSEYTQNFLTEIDELLIMVDDSLHENVSWKKFILEVKGKVASSKLLFNKTFDFSKHQEIRKYLNYDKIYLLPDLTYDVMKNNYMNEPVIYYTESALTESYKMLTLDLLNVQNKLELKDINKSKFKSVLKKAKQLLRM